MRTNWTTDVISPFHWPDYEFAALHTLEIQNISSDASMMNIAFANPVWWLAKPSPTNHHQLKKWPLADREFRSSDLSEQANSRWFTKTLSNWINQQSWSSQGKGVRLGPSRQATWHNEEHWKRVWKQIMESRVEFRKGNRIVLKETKPSFGINGFSIDDTNRQLWSSNTPVISTNKRFSDFYDDIKEEEGKACWQATVDIAPGLASDFQSIMNFDSTDEQIPQANDFTIMIKGPLPTPATIGNSGTNNRFLVIIRMASDNSEIQNQQVKEIQAKFASARSSRPPPHLRHSVWRKKQ